MTTAVRDFKDFRSFPGQVSGSIYEFPKLYSRDKSDRIRFWSLYIILINPNEVEENYGHNWTLNAKMQKIDNSFFDSSNDVPYYALIFNEQGIIDGKLSRHPPTIVTEGSSGLKGKANARNAFTQALINARSAYQKKIDDGYTLSPDVKKEKSSLYFAMAAHRYDDHLA